MNDIYARNMKIYTERMDGFEPFMTEKLEAVDTKGVIIEYSADQEPIAAIERDNRLWYLNSRYQAEKAAQIWVDSIGEWNYKSVFLVYGLSNGMYVRELLRRLGEENIVLLIEPSAKLFKAVMENIDLCDILSDRRLLLFTQEFGLNGFKCWFKTVMRFEMLGISKAVPLPGYELLFSEELKQFQKVYNVELTLVYAGKNTAIAMAAEMADNHISNLMVSAYASDVMQLEAQLCDVDKSMLPAIIVGAGPSLDKNVQQLKAAVNKALIIATDSAINVLLRNGIIPDLLVTVDSHKPLTLFEDERVKEIPLVACTQAVHQVLLQHTGKIFMFAINEYVDGLYQKIGKKLMPLATGGSVANNAFSLAVTLGFSTIIFVGQDLAFTDDKKHAANVYQEKGIGEDPEDEYCEIEGYNGGKVLTFTNFRLYRDWFESEINDYSGVRFINATEGGALIRGAENMTLQDAIQTSCSNETQIDLRHLINQAENTFNAAERDAMIKEIQHIPHRAEELICQFEEGIQCYEQLKQTVISRQQDTAKLQRVIQVIGEVNQLGESELLMKLINLYAKQAEYTAMEDIYNENQNELEIADRGIALLQAYIEGAQRVKERAEQMLAESRREAGWGIYD